MKEFDDFEDYEATPRVIRVINADEPRDGTPYIPRRKSSINDHNFSEYAASSINIASSQPTISIRTQRIGVSGSGRSHGGRPATKTQFGDYIQRARFPIDGYDPVSLSMTCDPNSSKFIELIIGSHQAWPCTNCRWQAVQYREGHFQQLPSQATDDFSIDCLPFPCIRQAGFDVNRQRRIQMLVKLIPWSV